MEVDPYMAWMHQIDDAGPVINEFVNQTARETLERANRKPRKYDSCAAVAKHIFRRNHRAILVSRPLLRHLRNNPQVDKFSRSHFKGISDSMYRYVPQLYVSSLADTINIDGIYMSTDKIGHIFGFGRRYYIKYLRALDAGSDIDSALRKAIRFGVGREKGLVGKTLDGIFSYADLEANFQGLQMIRSFCEGEDPNIVGTPGAWEWHHDTDIADYVLPTFDEGFLPNNFIKIYRPGIRKRLMRYCDIGKLPIVASRLKDYRARDEETVSRVYLREQLSGKEFQRPCDP